MVGVIGVASLCVCTTSCGGGGVGSGGGGGGGGVHLAMSGPSAAVPVVTLLGRYLDTVHYRKIF